MVQEVQTGVGITNETTLETIEAIGTSSFKIVEGRQTKGGRYSNGCKATGQVNWTWHSGDDRESEEKKSGNTTITSSYGKQEFTMYNGGVRVPVAGTYEIVLFWGCSTSYNKYTIIIKGGGKTIYTKTYNSSATETVTLHADLGKFDTIEIWGQFYYGGSADVAGLFFSYQPELTITQL